MNRPFAAVAALALLVAACGEANPVITTEATIRSAVDAESTTTTTTLPATTTTTLPPSGPPIAQEGNENETVEALQFLLNCNGYGDLTVDGEYGPATREAVEAAQTAMGREVTGAPDEETFADLARTCSDARQLSGEDGVTTIVGNAAIGDPEVISVALLKGSILGVSVLDGLGITVTVRDGEGTAVPPDDGSTTWTIEQAGNYTIEIGADPGPATFSVGINVVAGSKAGGDWILATDGITYKGTELGLGDDADTVIDHIFDFLGHGVRGAYAEFDTDWYTITDPQDLGLRGIFIEGLAFLFFGPSPGDPGRAETLDRIRFEGPSDDAEGNPRPDDYVTTAEGITVGNTLLELKAAYGDDVAKGSNSEEHYYRYSDSGGELCFYFGGSAPGDSDEILEISTECRS